ncbi:hypothetical protein RJT34_17400 [Clitoria ternatea]|uniref:Fe2OG dioxygenase domain-containing protein n=1 Tax=Clitoria ternatea TaxID=43366 RepID=A0AAN9JAI4_CLITE
MAEITSFFAQSPHPDQLKFAPPDCNVSFQPAMASNIHQADPYSASDDEIPTIDYSLLFSHDPTQQFHALENLRHACQEYGFFYLVNHTIPDELLDNVLKGFSDFVDPTTIDERKVCRKNGPLDKIRWDLNSSEGENREYLKLVAHPHFHAPPNSREFSKFSKEYNKAMRVVVGGLARAVSKTLGLEENYIEKAFDLKSGFDVMAMNLYPPNSRSRGSIGLPEHTDPGFVVTLVQDIDGGLQILSHHGKWINVYIPCHAILIQLGDHLEVQRISVVTLHGPSQDKYRGMTYKESLVANGGDEIDVQSSIQQLRLV